MLSAPGMVARSVIRDDAGALLWRGAEQSRVGTVEYIPTVKYIGVVYARLERADSAGWIGCWPGDPAQVYRRCGHEQAADGARRCDVM